MAENEEAGQKDSSFHELWQRLPAHQIDPVRWFLVLGWDYPRIQEAFVSFWFHGNASQSGTTEDCNQLTQKATKLICLSIFTLPLTSNISTICFQRNRWGEDRERVDPSLVWHQLNLNFEFAILNSQLSSSILNSQAQFSILRYGINSSSTTGQSGLLVLAACISVRSISQIYF